MLPSVLGGMKRLKYSGPRDIFTPVSEPIGIIDQSNLGSKAWRGRKVTQLFEKKFPAVNCLRQVEHHACYCPQ